MKRANAATKTRREIAPSDVDENLRLDNQICFPLYAAARLIVNAYRPLLDDLGLTYPQYLVLLVLWEHDGQNVGAIGERLHLDTGTLTPLLKRLEAQGLVKRRRSAEDDRVVENWLTPEGKALKKRAAAVPVDLLCAAQLDYDSLLPLKRSLDRLITALLRIQ